ncbi:MAG: TMEM165/GDT1 family protein [Gammaproteobacteria bacterium]
MDIKLFLTVAITVFVAEIADKTQLATMLFAADGGASRLVVFAGATAALTLSSALAVFAGSLVAGVVDATLMSRIAGVLFVGIGVWTFITA